jgi:hypothetical protein
VLTLPLPLTSSACSLVHNKLLLTCNGICGAKRDVYRCKLVS